MIAPPARFDVSYCHPVASAMSVAEITYDRLMSRWEPNARGRLEQAAMDLYRERGFDQTTVEEIAARAGLTERTFFRYFADKREVLFWGSGALQDFLVERLASAADLTAPIDGVAATFEALGDQFEERRAFARQRHALIAAHEELQERELIKLASLASAIADALRRRGVPDPAATLTAETGVTIFKIAFEQWVSDAKRRDLAHHVRRSLDELKAVAAGKLVRGARPSSRATGASSRPKPPQGRRPR
jgi:AcrR family transcriptional regulator